jgi:hypothetical protein
MYCYYNDKLLPVVYGEDGELLLLGYQECQAARLHPISC